MSNNTNETELLARAGLSVADISVTTGILDGDACPRTRKVLSAIARLRDEAEQARKLAAGHYSLGEFEKANFENNRSDALLADMGMLLAMVLR